MESRGNGGTESQRNREWNHRGTGNGITREWRNEIIIEWGMKIIEGTGNGITREENHHRMWNGVTKEWGWEMEEWNNDRMGE